MFPCSSRCSSLSASTWIQCKWCKSCTIRLKHTELWRFWFPTNKFEDGSLWSRLCGCCSWSRNRLACLQHPSVFCAIPRILLGQDERVCSQLSQEVQVVGRLPFHQCRCCSQSRSRRRRRRRSWGQQRDICGPGNASEGLIPVST